MTIDPFHFETGVYRPPSEGGSASLLVRFTRNCPWNHCTFCAMYKTEKFEVRPVGEICQDINAMAALAKALTEQSLRLGHDGRVTQSSVLALMERYPGLDRHPGAAMLINWLASGGKTAFIQDGNSLIMKPDDLIAALTHLKITFPSITRITTYARARTLSQRSTDTLTAIRNAGLDRVHIGLETGDDALLKQIKKGVDAQGQINGGQKAMAAGFQVSEYWMPGLGGSEMTQQHAANTARVLNAVNPHYIRSRPFRPIPGTPLNEQVRSGQITPLSPRGQLLEIRGMVKALEVTSKVCFDHAGNFWRTKAGDLVFSHDYEGYKFPEEKTALLDRIEQGLAWEQPESAPFISL